MGAGHRRRFVELPQKANASLLMAVRPWGAVGHGPYDRAAEANVAASCGSCPIADVVARKPL